MVEKKCEDYLTAFSSFLHKTSLDYLAEKHKDNFKLNDLVKDFLEVLCSFLAENYNAITADHFDEEICFLSSFVGQIPELFPCNVFLEGFKDCFKVLTDDGKDIVQAIWLCKIVLEIFKSSSLLWLLQIKKVEDCEVSDLDKPKDGIIVVLLYLLKHIDLMSCDANKLENHQTLKLVPIVTLLCHSILRKLHENTDNLPNNISRNLEISIIRKIACAATLVAMQHTGKFTWVSEISKKVAFDFLEFVTKLCGCDHIEALLSGFDERSSNTGFESNMFPNGLFRDILQSIKQFAIKDKLVDLPVVIHMLVWSTRRVCHPFLGQHISMILPPLLLLVDDFRVSNQVTGIKMLEHVIKNTNATELCWYGRAEVIYEALCHHIYTNEPEVMIVLQPCLLKILKVMEPSPKKPTPGRKMNKCDQNFQIILSAMEFESKIVMRRAYCSHLVQFINHMGITVLRHFKRLLRVIARYLEISDGDTEEWRLTMLDVLKAIIINAWPRIPSHADQILRNLLKLVVDVSTSCVILAETKQNIFIKIKECFSLLLFCCGQPVERQLKTMMTGLNHIETEELISETLQHYNSHLK